MLVCCIAACRSHSEAINLLLQKYTNTVSFIWLSYYTYTPHIIMHTVYQLCNAVASAYNYMIVATACKTSLDNYALCRLQ